MRPTEYDNAEGKNFLLSYLPYSGKEPYPSRHMYGSYEEMFHTREAAKLRMQTLISEGRVEYAKVYQGVLGFPLGRMLVDEWRDA